MQGSVFWHLKHTTLTQSCGSLSPQLTESDLKYGKRPRKKAFYPIYGELRLYSGVVKPIVARECVCVVCVCVLVPEVWGYYVVCVGSALRSTTTGLKRESTTKSKSDLSPACPRASNVGP